MSQFDAPAAGGGDFLIAIRKLLRTQSWTRHWGEPTFNDAVQDVALLSIHTQEDVTLASSFNDNFCTPEYEAMKQTIFSAMKIVREKYRFRRRIEVSKTSVDHDGPAGKRRRRDLPPNESLGDRVVPARDTHEASWMTQSDISSAMAALTPIQREIVTRKVQEKQSWTKISEELGRSRDWVQRQYKAALAQLKHSLHSYDPVSG